MPEVLLQYRIKLSYANARKKSLARPVHRTLSTNENSFKTLFLFLVFLSHHDIVGFMWVDVHHPAHEFNHGLCDFAWSLARIRYHHTPVIPATLRSVGAKRLHLSVHVQCISEYFTDVAFILGVFESDRPVKTCDKSWLGKGQLWRPPPSCRACRGIVFSFSPSHIYRYYTCSPPWLPIAVPLCLDLFWGLDFLRVTYFLLFITTCRSKAGRPLSTSGVATEVECYGCC